MNMKRLGQMYRRWMARFLFALSGVLIGWMAWMAFRAPVSPAWRGAGTGHGDRVSVASIREEMPRIAHPPGALVFAETRRENAYQALCESDLDWREVLKHYAARLDAMGFAPEAPDPLAGIWAAHGFRKGLWRVEILFFNDNDADSSTPSTGSEWRISLLPSMH